MFKVKLIAALDNKNGIGKNGRLPWDLPSDRQYFRSLIMNGPVVMGMNTFASNGFQPFGQGKNIVITRYLDDRLKNVEVNNDAKVFFKNLKEDVWVVGGGQVFAEALPYATELYLTRVDGVFGADTFFPEFEKRFKLKSESVIQTENGINFKYQVWEVIFTQ